MVKEEEHWFLVEMAIKKIAPEAKYKAMTANIVKIHVIDEHTHKVYM